MALFDSLVSVPKTSLTARKATYICTKSHKPKKEKKKSTYITMHLKFTRNVLVPKLGWLPRVNRTTILGGFGKHLLNSYRKLLREKKAW